ncbi:MAG: TauD/TfdA family dioxygenase [Potamolinea sp.]
MKINTTPLSQQFGTIVLGSNDTNSCELDTQEIISLFKSSSLLLFRGFEVDTDKFKQLTEQFGTNFVSYVGGAYSREMINGDKTLLSVTGGKLHFAVPFHGEMYYRKHRPDLLWFYCATPALKDGETTVCDGIQVYQQLSHSTQELFNQKRLKYIRTYAADVWPKIYQTEDINTVEQVCKENDMQLQVQEDESIKTEYVSSAVKDSRCGQHKVFINNILPVIEQEAKGSNSSIVRFEDNSPIPDEIINEIKQVTDKLTYLVSWQKGDILIIDNTRLLHGRRSFSDNQRDIYVRLCDAAFPF